jgi:hypothetical protein
VREGPGIVGTSVQSVWLLLGVLPHLPVSVRCTLLHDWLVTSTPADRAWLPARAAARQWEAEVQFILRSSIAITNKQQYGQPSAPAHSIARCSYAVCLSSRSWSAASQLIRVHSAAPRGAKSPRCSHGSEPSGAIQLFKSDEVG